MVLKNSPSTTHAVPFEGMADSALVQFAYTSEPTLSSRLDTSMFASIEAEASVNNKMNNITGVLTYGNGAFFQCIEGKKAQVIELIDKIYTDKRHKNIKILLSQPITERKFRDWRMRMIFLEPWAWSPETRKKANRLIAYLPFKPDTWMQARVEKFLDVIQNFESTLDAKAAGATFNSFGKVMQRIVGPHQAFLMVQVTLGIFVTIATFELIKMTH